MIEDIFRVTVATKDGAYFLTPEEGREKWELSKPFLPEENVNKVVSDGQENLFAATLSEGVFKSRDGGKTWKPASRGLHVRKVWEVAADPHRHGTIYAGTQYGHLFRSTNSGDSWDEVTSLHDAPNRLEWGIDWGFRTTGLALHTIRFDMNDPKKIYLVASGNGAYRSDDEGETWKSLKSGQNTSCSIDPSKQISSAPSGASTEEKVRTHLAELHSCTHKIVVSPKDGRLYQQNHCGVYFSDSHGDRWKDVSINAENRFGFPVDVVETTSTNVFVIPVPDNAPECKDHNACIQGQLSVYGTSDGGKNWKRYTNGLPERVHTNVLRDSLAHDNLREPGLYFGTTVGNVFFSEDLGNSWRRIASGLGRIQGINVTVA